MQIYTTRRIAQAPSTVNGSDVLFTLVRVICAVTMKICYQPSAELYAVNRCLLSSRASRQGKQPKSSPAKLPAELSLPAHLGWGGMQFTKQLLSAGIIQPPKHTTPPNHTHKPPNPPPVIETSSSDNLIPNEVKLYPELGIAVLRAKLIPSFGLYLRSFG